MQNGEEAECIKYSFIFFFFFVKVNREMRRELVWNVGAKRGLLVLNENSSDILKI